MTNPVLDVRVLGRMDYAAALTLQESLVLERRDDRIPDTLLLVEHPPVFTLGRGTTEAALPHDTTIPVVEISRGGDVTYHGPGQVVGYWIKKLEGPERDLHRHLRAIEGTVIRAIARFGLDGRREPGKTGVWIGAQKVCSIGVAVRHWVTYHGFALNVAIDPSVYGFFRPCGLEGSVMTDVTAAAGTPITWSVAAAAVETAFRTPAAPMP